MGTDYKIEKNISAESDLNNFAVTFSKFIKPGMVVGLAGDMGSGKTTFVRLLGHALGTKDWVNSPTYSIIQSYETSTVTIVHIDLYRCESEMAIDQLDIPSLLNQQSMLIIEWIDRTTQIKPDITCSFEYIDDTHRNLTISSSEYSWVEQL